SSDLPSLLSTIPIISANASSSSTTNTLVFNRVPSRALDIVITWLKHTGQVPVTYFIVAFRDIAAKLCRDRYLTWLDFGLLTGRQTQYMITRTYRPYRNPCHTTDQVTHILDNPAHIRVAHTAGTHRGTIQGRRAIHHRPTPLICRSLNPVLYRYAP